MVTIVMTTYNPEPSAPRFQYARQCLDAWDLYAMLSDSETLDFVVTDDGSPDVGPLIELHTRDGVIVRTGSHGGIGASLNRALESVAGPWVYTTDDWLLTDYLDLDLPLWLLSQGYDMVRLGPIHPELSCTTKFTQGHGWWLHVLPTPNYAAATRPFMASPSLLPKIGPFMEGVDSYMAETTFAMRCSEAGILIAAINLAGPWEHIGEYEVGNRPV